MKRRSKRDSRESWSPIFSMGVLYWSYWNVKKSNSQQSLPILKGLQSMSVTHFIEKTPKSDEFKNYAKVFNIEKTPKSGRLWIMQHFFFIKKTPKSGGFRNNATVFCSNIKDTARSRARKKSHDWPDIMQRITWLTRYYETRHMIDPILHNVSHYWPDITQHVTILTLCYTGGPSYICQVCAS